MMSSEFSLTETAQSIWTDMLQHIIYIKLREDASVILVEEKRIPCPFSTTYLYSINIIIFLF